MLTKTASASVTQTSVCGHNCPGASVSGQEPPVRRIWPFSKVIPQTLLGCSASILFGTLLHTWWGKKYTNREDLAAPPVNLWACLRACSCLPLCGVSINASITFTCSLAQFSSTLEVFTPSGSLSLRIFCFFSMHHCHWSKNKYCYSPVVNKPFSDPMSSFTCYIFLLPFSTHLSKGVDTLTVLFLHLDPHFFISHAL